MLDCEDELSRNNFFNKKQRVPPPKQTKSLRLRNFHHLGPVVEAVCHKLFSGSIRPLWSHKSYWRPTFKHRVYRTAGTLQFGAAFRWVTYQCQLDGTRNLGMSPSSTTFRLLLVGLNSLGLLWFDFRLHHTLVCFQFYCADQDISVSPPQLIHHESSWYINNHWRTSNPPQIALP